MSKRKPKLKPAKRAKRASESVRLLRDIHKMCETIRYVVEKLERGLL